MPWIHAMIDPQGKEYPCCMLRTTRRLDDFVKKSKGFRAIWEGNGFRDFRQRMLAPDGRPAPCHACDDFIEENRFLQRLVVSA